MNGLHSSRVGVSLSPRARVPLASTSTADVVPVSAWFPPGWGASRHRLAVKPRVLPRTDGATRQGGRAFPNRRSNDTFATTLAPEGYGRAPPAADCEPAPGAGVYVVAEKMPWRLQRRRRSPLLRHSRCHSPARNSAAAGITSPTGVLCPPSEALASINGKYDAVYRWNAEAQTYVSPRRRCQDSLGDGPDRRQHPAFSSPGKRTTVVELYHGYRVGPGDRAFARQRPCAVRKVLQRLSPVSTDDASTLLCPGHHSQRGNHHEHDRSISKPRLAASSNCGWTATRQLRTAPSI